ncbi:MAG: hypothetical protein E7375_03520 [Clostridiales bacterium]|nr:hypothetical protein [Clostridiales bacterium]
MAKTLRNIFISLFGTFAFLFAGFFIAGCGIDYSIIKLVSDKENVQLEVGETTNITLTIENYQKGFSNLVEVIESNSSKFECTTINYFEDKIRLSILGKAGGEGYLTIQTYDGKKECRVNVDVVQYATSFSNSGVEMYVSNDTAFEPDAGMFTFDTNTTYKDLSYYYFKPETQFDSTYKLMSIEGTEATFSNGEYEIDAEVIRFDKIILKPEGEGDNAVYLVDGETERRLGIFEQVPIMAVYNYSINNDTYENILCCFSDVYVLPNIDLQVFGGYVNTATGKVDDFQELSFSAEGGFEEIIIVPNNSRKAQYILKFEFSSSVAQTYLDFIFKKSNSNAVFDFCDYQEEGATPENNVYYFKVSQNSHEKAVTEVTVNMFYDVVKNVEDESVNAYKYFRVLTQIAPTDITVNGTTDPETLVMYNYYRYPDFGWNELVLNVISSYGALPEYEGIYFTFDEEYIDLIHNGVTVRSYEEKPDESVLYTFEDLQQSFYIRGQYGTRQANSDVTIHLLSDIMEGASEISLTIRCMIIAGATIVSPNSQYGDNGYYYLDYSQEVIDFSGQIYTDQRFQYITYRFLNGVDVVDISLDESQPYIKQGTNYYLNLSLAPKITGVGIYRVFLDNGMPIDLTFNVIKTLSEDSTTIALANEDNAAVANFETYETEGYNGGVLVEILNPSTKEEIIFGNEAFLTVNANVGREGVEFVPQGSTGVSSVVYSNSVYRIMTLKNGVQVYEVELNGFIVNEFFKQVSNSLKYELRVVSYSLAEEFYLKSGAGYALNNVIYYGTNVKKEDTLVNFSAVANHEDSYAFYKYSFDEKAFPKIFETATDISSEEEEPYYSYVLDGSEYAEKIVYAGYSEDFLSFKFSSGSRILTTSIDVTITKTASMEEEQRVVRLTFTDGLIFLPEDFEYVEEDEEGKITSYRVEFLNGSVFYVGGYGEFNVDDFSYRDVQNNTHYTITMNTYLNQRKSLKRYEAKIACQAYQFVEGISLASSLEKLEFSNNNLTQTLGVYCYPTSATNKDIKAQFIPSSANTFSDMVAFDIDDVQGENGVFTISVSCEKFYNENKDIIVEINIPLTGKLYIWPSEWADSYTDIKNDFSPICLDVQFRNGSKANPYLIETAEDLVKINSNEATLRSHYEIKSVVDVSTVENFVPIGILDGELVGFSGTIIGTTSQSKVANIVVTKDNFYTEVGGVGYGGLFAQLNAVYYTEEGSLDQHLQVALENISFSGKIDLETERRSFVGLAIANNNSKIRNCEVEILRSNIKTTNQLYYGGLVARNFGEIVQDFTKYDGTGYDPVIDAVDCTNLLTKNLAFYSDFVTIETTADLYAGGIVGVSAGQIETISSEILKKYGYTAYASYTLLKIVGEMGTNTPNIGGAVGSISNFGVSYAEENFVKNLLVGGEIDASGLNTLSVLSGLGGIVGSVDTQKILDISILSNTSRVFLRAGFNVGGIVGYDAYNTTYTKATVFGQENKMQAVDDGRNSFYSAMIIRYQSNDGDVSLPATEAGKAGFFAIGNSPDNIRDYTASSTAFVVESYLDRIVIPVSNVGVLVNLTANLGTQKYGDYIVATKVDEDTAKICTIYEFEKKDVELGFEEDLPFRMISDDSDLDVFFMYYFAVEGYVNGQTSIDIRSEVDGLNVFAPNSELYPFAIKGSDVSIETGSTSVMNIDVGGNITIKDTGLAEITVSSILNTLKQKKFYVFVVNYFDKDVTSSIYYTSASLNGVNISDESVVSIYGDSSTSVNVVPTYNYSGEEFSITKNGVLRYKNADYVLTKNNALTSDCGIYDTDENGQIITDNHGNPVLLDSGYFSGFQINKQTLVFYKNSDAVGGEVDSYKLTPILKVSCEGKEFYFKINKASLYLNVDYQETATAIRPSDKRYILSTNDYYDAWIEVESLNENEMLFYEVIGPNGTVVQRFIPDFDLPADLTEWDEFINNTTGCLFDFNFEKRGGQNVFDYTWSVNSDVLLTMNKENVFGVYTINLYANQLFEGVVGSFEIVLEEAEVGYISIKNYSDFNDLSESGKVLVPSQRGLLEINIDPAEAVVEEVTISNNERNYLDGANVATFVFVNEIVGPEGVDYVMDTNFAQNIDGSLSFNFAKMLEEYDRLGIDYTGTFFVSYYMASTNMEDGGEVAFDVTTKSTNGIEFTATIPLKVKLTSYAKLVFNDKQEQNDFYYVARGLSYDLSLEYYGFSEDQIEVKSLDESVASISRVGDNQYQLNITRNSINYNPNQDGYIVALETVATKVVDTELEPVEVRNKINLCIMEYVVNYIYEEGTNEDIVKGMVDGVINTAIGNPYELEFAIRDYLEYDPTISQVDVDVERFVREMTQSIMWQVYLNNVATTLEEGKTIVSDFYKIESFTFTPMKIYNAVSDIYHFSAGATYSMNEGRYYYDDASRDRLAIYTEFSFEVHDQSTQDSPLPITTYEELIDMKEGEWYILLKDILLPSSEYAMANNVKEFKPISTEIAGLDGNGYKLLFDGTYNLTGLSDIGVFSTITEEMIVKNLTVQLVGSVVFNTNVESFNIGLIAGTNSGVVTNCLTDSNDYVLSVVTAVDTNSSYVAGLVANNSGFITNSRSKVNLYSNENLSGFVGENSGIIASSYFMGASLKNETSGTGEYTAGFVIKNTGTGEIYTSYTSGTPNGSEVYYSDDKDLIESSNNVSGFVYTNAGKIADCYSNVLLKKSGFFAAGFVFENSGSVERCFSTSVLASERSSKYGFAGTNAIDSNRGTILDCFFLQDVGINVSVGELANSEYIDITPLTRSQFGEMQYFEDFAYVEGREVGAVWFFETNAGNLNNFNGSVFNTGRLELIAPNIVATSRRDFDRFEELVDAETGATYIKYHYVYNSSYPALGSLYNPIVISSAEEMENYILQENDSADYNYSYYRLISDINYEDYSYNSSLYTTKFRGLFEGNFMTISNVNLLSSKASTSAGLFAEISKSLTNPDSVGAVLNLNIQPITVSFANSNVVGTLAGKLDGGYVANISINRSTSSLVVVGNNIVGGVVGLATGNYKLHNVYSQLGAKARYQMQSNSNISGNNFVSNTSAYQNFSFAGSVVGILSGNGEIYNCLADSAVSVLADKAGILFGLVDSGALAKKIKVEMSDGFIVNGYSYAGLVVGETKGNLLDIDVVGSGSYYQNFRQIPFIPQAIGGVAGLISGGTIENVTMTQDIRSSTESSNESIENLGGIAGIVTGSTRISNVVVEGSLLGYENVGGIVGTAKGSVYLENVQVEAALNIYGREQTRISLGGAVAKVEGDGFVRLEVANGFMQNRIVVTTTANVYVYNTNITIYIGGIIGGNENERLHNINDTFSSVTGDSFALDMSIVYEETVGNLVVVDNEGVFELDASNSNDVVFASQLASTNCEYYCDLSFTTVTPGPETKVYQMIVSVYGDPIGLLQN